MPDKNALRMQLSPRRPPYSRTIPALARFFDCDESTIRRALRGLKGRIFSTARTDTGKRGRPATIYAALK